jgi:hypothetical protein
VQPISISNLRHTFRHKTVHHSLYQFNFVLKREIDEICVDEYTVGRSKRFVVRQEEGSRQGVSITQNGVISDAAMNLTEQTKQITLFSSLPSSSPLRPFVRPSLRSP